MQKWKCFAMVALLVAALGVAGCGGGGSTATEEEMPMPTPQEMCENADGRWNADETCTSAAELVMERQAAQRSAISTAIGTATTAVNAVDNDSSGADVSAADTALANARSAIAAADDLSDEEKAANTGTVNALATVLASAKTARMAAMDEADRAANAAMMADARKLHAGISTPASTGDTIRNAAYNTADTAISVTIGTAASVDLSEDKKTTVAANHGWEGTRYTAAPTDDGTYEAVVYSDVGESEEGAKFSATYPYNTTDVGGTNTELTIDTSNAAVAARVASPSFDQSAGSKAFKLPGNTVRVVIPGSYHGVSGTYYCTPSGGDCSATVAASGFTLANGTWTFKANNADDRLMDVADSAYASYGWWIHKSQDGKTFTASAFVDNKGNAPDAISTITALRGTATYMGGAAGKYALYSATGGTNDAGHFTARATLEADFNADMITGTIDNFMGADGQARNWSVELKKSGIGNDGAITGTDGTGDPMETVWTIDGTASASAGQWSGSLQDNGDDGVPKVATGTFRSTYSTSGEMVGAFGANKQ